MAKLRVFVQSALALLHVYIYIHLHRWWQKKNVIVHLTRPYYNTITIAMATNHTIYIYMYTLNMLASSNEQQAERTVLTSCLSLFLGGSSNMFLYSVDSSPRQRSKKNCKIWLTSTTTRRHHRARVFYHPKIEEDKKRRRVHAAAKTNMTEIL